MHNVSVEKLADYDDHNRLGAEMMRSAYYIMYVTSIVKCLMLEKAHWWSR